MANFLEQLVREWYQYQGYFVLQNVNVAKRAKGGYDCELDVVAFNPEKRHLVHIEPSMDADSWATRDRRFKRKFDVGKKHIPQLLTGLDLPETIDQIALLVFASTKNRSKVGGGQILILEQFIKQILESLSKTKMESAAVPEQWPLLKTLQAVSDSRESIMSVWQE